MLRFASRRLRWRPGPGVWVTAAFIGPGTVATATRAGAEYQFALLWTLVFAVIATITFQEMAARAGLVTRRGLTEAIRATIRPPGVRRAALTLVLAAIVIGNTAYQTGNLIGAGLGLTLLTGLPIQLGSALVGLVVMLAIAVGRRDHFLHSALVGLVVAMSIAFLVSAVIVRPSVASIAGGVVGLELPSGSLTTVLALLGTTIVPYNLFLHARLAIERWPQGQDLASALHQSRIDTVIAVTVGGIVTLAIVITAAASFPRGDAAAVSASDLATQLRPLLGGMGHYVFGIGLAAAGTTSAITAPLAAGFTVEGAASSRSSGNTHRIVTATALCVAMVGTLLACGFGKSPQSAILFAQATNALLLPLVAAFLLWVMNRQELLGEFRNRTGLNVLGGLVVVIATGLCIRSMAALF